MLKFYTPDTLDFEKLKKDLERWKVITGGTYSEIAASLYRAPGYISNIFNAEKIRADVLDGICDCCGLNAEHYMIRKPEPEKVGWWTAITRDGKRLRVDLWCDGTLISSGWGTIWYEDNRGMAQAISYATNQAYKALKER